MRHLLTLLFLGLGQGLDLTSLPIPKGFNIQKIQSLMRSVDPKSCGCARPDQHCEVPVPEARFVGFSCRVGQFCCRLKKTPGPIDIKTIPENIADVDTPENLPIPKTIRVGAPQEFKMTRNKPGQFAVPRQDDVSIIEMREDPTTTTTTQRAVTQRPVFDPNQKKRVVNMDNLQPYDLGFPKDVKAFIRPVSHLGKRTLNTAVDLATTKAPSSYSSVCRCENMESCPAEKRDYITFRKSCPYGQVQCCRTFGSRDGFENLSKVSGLAQVSQIRPVHIPVPLVPTTTTTTSTTTTVSTSTVASTASESVTEPLTTPLTTAITTAASEGPTEPQTTPTIAPSKPTTTPASVRLFSATPYTIVSSSYSVTKLEWDNPDEEEGEKDTAPAELTTTTTPLSTTLEEVTTTTTPLPITASVAKVQPNYPPRRPVFITPQRNTPHHLLRHPGPPQRLPVPPHHLPQRLAPGQAPPTRHTRPGFVLPQQQGSASGQPVRVFVPHGQRPPGPGAPQAAVPGQVVFVGNDGKLHRVPQQPLRRPTPQQIQQQQLFRQQLQQQKPLKRQIKPQDVQGIRPAENKWPRPTPFLQPPSSTRFIDRSGQETGRGYQLGFIESVGQAAINVATGLFSWPFQFK